MMVIREGLEPSTQWLKVLVDSFIEFSNCAAQKLEANEATRGQTDSKLKRLLARSTTISWSWNIVFISSTRLLSTCQRWLAG